MKDFETSFAGAKGAITTGDQRPSWWRRRRTITPATLIVLAISGIIVIVSMDFVGGHSGEETFHAVWWLCCGLLNVWLFADSS